MLTTTSLTVLCVTQISWFTSMVADAVFQGILCAGGPACLGFAINNTLAGLESLDKVNINAAVVIFLGLALALIQWFHLWMKVLLVLFKCGGSWTVWTQSFCNLMDRNQPRDLLDDFMIVNPLDHNGSGKRLSETEPIYGDAFDERAIETPPRISTATVVGEKDWLRSKYSINEKSPASTVPVLRYDPFPCTTLDFDVPVVEIDKPGSPIYTLPASYASHRYSSDNLSALPSDENLPSARYAPVSRRQSVASFDSRNSGEYPRPSYDIYRSSSGNNYRLVDASRPPSVDLHRVDAAVPPPVRPARTPSQHAQRPAFDLYQEHQDQEEGSDGSSHEPSSTLHEHSSSLYDPAPVTHYNQTQYSQTAASQEPYDPTQSARYAEPPSSVYDYSTRYDQARYEVPGAPRYSPPSSRYELPTSPSGSHSLQRSGARPRSYHSTSSHGVPKAPRGQSHPPVARSKSYVGGGPYENAPPPARSKSYGHGGAREPQAPAPVRRYSQDDGSSRRWSQSSYTSLPRVPSMLRHSEVSDSAVEL